MEQERLALTRELCFIANVRNKINVRRHRARYRKNYYSKAVAVIEAHNKSNRQTRLLTKKIKTLSDLFTDEQNPEKTSLFAQELKSFKTQLDKIHEQMNLTVLRTGPALKWKAMGLMRLRSLELQGQGEYAFAKYETMEHTIKTTQRVKELISMLKCAIFYENGSIVNIYNTQNDKILFEEEIAYYATEYELNLAVEKMVEE